MKASFEQLKEEMKLKHISLSHHRLEVLAYLHQKQGHPTVDQIYTDLQKSIATLSKTTVYNTLRTLEKAGLVRCITIEGHETRYDIEITEHGHFKCESCGSIIDFDLDFGHLISDELAGFRISDKSVYFKGICPRCLKQMEKKMQGGETG